MALFLADAPVSIDQLQSILSRLSELRKKGDTMAEAKMVTFHLRNGEQRTYKDITRLDTSRPHTVLVYYKDELIAQIAKNDIVKITQQDGR